jgi:hypothetical protein
MVNQYTDMQRVQFRMYMGVSKLFSSAVADFENTLNGIQSIAFDDGSTFQQTLAILALLQNIDAQIVNNSQLGLGSEVEGTVKFDAYRNDVMLRRIGRGYIRQLSIVFSMKPVQDYYGKAIIDTAGLSNVHNYQSAGGNENI